MKQICASYHTSFKTALQKYTQFRLRYIQQSNCRLANGIALGQVSARAISDGAIAPGVVGIGDQLGAVFGIDRYNITLQVLLEPISAEQICRICAITVLHTDGGAFGIIHIDNYMLGTTNRPFLGYDLTAVEPVGMLYAVSLHIIQYVATKSN